MSLPKYKHFCLDCVFLGNEKILKTNEDVDLYYCMSSSHQTFVVKYGDSEKDFHAGMMNVKDSVEQTKTLMNALGEKPTFNKLIEIVLKEKTNDYLFVKALEKAFHLNLIDEDFVMKPLVEKVCLPSLFSGDMLPTFRFEDSNVGVIDVSFKISKESKSVVVFFRPNAGKAVMYERSLYSYAKDIDTYFRSFLGSSWNLDDFVNFFSGNTFNLEKGLWLGLKSGIESGVFTVEDLDY